MKLFFARLFGARNPYKGTIEACAREFDLHACKYSKNADFLRGTYADYAFLDAVIRRCQ